MAKHDKAAKTAKPADEIKVILKNRKLRHDYEVLDSWEAGMVLIGSEVRSLRQNSADLADAWVDIDQRGEAWVKGLRIPPLNHAAFGHEERRPRKLLLHREQVDRVRGSLQRDGMTLIVTQCYFKANRAKLEIAVARGRKKYDKRQAIKERDMAKEARDAMNRGKRR